MSEENESKELQNEEFDISLPQVELNSNETMSDGIEIITDDSLENYTQNQEELEEEVFELTLAETKKLYRVKLKKGGNIEPMPNDKELLGLSPEVIEELKEIRKTQDRKALLCFVNNKKQVNDEEAANLTEEEFLELTNKALVMSRFLNYNTKKDFGVAYKKKRQNKNKQAKASRRANR